MTLRIVGASVGRTGTASLKLALERLLGGDCYHMDEVFAQPEHIPVWHAAASGTMPHWAEFLGGYVATTDWPVAAFWPEISKAFPDAIVLLSTRDSVSWWESAHATIFPVTRAAAGTEWHAMFDAVLGARFTNDLDNREACIEAFERYITEVRDAIPARRLLEWRIDDGWEPLCAALDLPVPQEPFPHANSRAEWLARHK